MNNKLLIKLNSFFIKKIIVIGVFIVLFFCFVSIASAATIKLSTAKDIFYQQEKFSIDIFLMPDIGEDLNAFELTLNHSSNVKFLGSDESSSIAGLWIEKPVDVYNKIHFSGVIPGGFTGVINPLNKNALSDKKPGILTRLIFSGNKEGIATFNFSDQNILANDGFGTPLGVNSNSISIKIDEKIVASDLRVEDVNPPQNFSILLSNDPLLFGGKYSVIFETKDKDSGIDFYEVKEEGRDWKKTGSPYLLYHQPPIGTIYVRATDHSGNSTIEELTPNIPALKIGIFSKVLAVIIVLIIVVFSYIMVLFLKYLKKKFFKRMSL